MKLYTCIFLFTFLSASAISPGSIQKVENVYSTITPKISPDGRTIITYDGQTIRKVDLSSGNSDTLAFAENVYAFSLNDNCEQLSFIRAEYGADNMRTNVVEQLSLVNNKKRTRVNAGRDLSTSAIAQSGGQKHSVGIHYGHLTLDGKTIDPQGKGSYLWPALSPDTTKIVYWLVGKGCFVCDLDGKNSRELGELRAPAWIDDNTIVGMRDRDNGEIITQSSLISFDLSSGNCQTLTPDDIVAMYPDASPRRIVFTDQFGAVYYMDIER